jgi:hypothetical protein
MAITPLPVGGTLFGGGGGMANASPVNVGGGKNATAQNLGSPHAGVKSSLASGDPLSRSMGQYGKGHSFGLAGGQPLSKVRGGLGQMRRIRGGLGPGKTGQAGPANDYSMISPDTE